MTGDIEEMGIGSAAWFAVQVRTNRESHCAMHLSTRGYELFLPCYREWRRWSDRRKSISKALFSGYLFCRLSRDVVAKIVTVPGVIRIVGDGTQPIAVSGQEIDALQRVIEQGHTVEPCAFVAAGRRVRIEDGPLQGVEATVLEVRGQHRVILSVSLLKRSVAVEIDPASLSPVSETAASRLKSVPAGSVDDRRHARSMQSH